MTALFFILAAVFLLGAALFFTSNKSNAGELVLKRDSDDPLFAALDKATNIDVDQGLLASIWNLRRTENVEEIVSSNVRTANSIIALLEARSKAYAHEGLFNAKLQLEHARIANQRTIIREATVLGLSPQEYAQFNLARLEAQLKTDVKEMEVKADLRVECFSLEETFRSVISKGRVHFEHQAILSGDIFKLQSDLLKVDTEKISAEEKKYKKQHFERLIKIKEAELAAQQETLPSGDRTRLGRVVEGTSYLEGPAE